MAERRDISVRGDRRQFLEAAAKGVAGLTLISSTSVLGAESDHTAASGDVALIDTHTHFYDPTRAQGVPWPPASETRLYRAVFPKAYRALPVPRPVTGTVVVEASPWGEDNQWVLDLAANEPFIVGVVGNLPVGTKQFAGHLKRFAGNKLFRGIRIRDRRLDGALDDRAFISDLHLLAENDLSLDLVGGADILPFADRLAREVPNLRIIIDHLAGVVVDGKVPPPDWVKQMRALAPRRRVFFKLSGLVEGTRRSDGSAPRDLDFYRPVLDGMVEMFGAGRLIYASNWPVSELYAPLATVQGIVEDYFRSRGRRATELVFALNAGNAYRCVRREK